MNVLHFHPKKSTPLESKWIKGLTHCGEIFDESPIQAIMLEESSKLLDSSGKRYIFSSL